MLLFRTTLKPSKLHGLGVFTQQPIKPGQQVYAFDLRVDRKFRKAEILELPLAVQVYLYHHVWKSKTSGLYCIHGDDSTYINHSVTPNLEILHEKDAANYGWEHWAVAAKYIAAGEELTRDYTQFDAIDFSEHNLWAMIREKCAPNDPAFADDDRFDELFYAPAAALQTPVKTKELGS